MGKAEEIDLVTRAEDIILGSLGFGEEASILSIEPFNNGFRGIGSWPDGEEFTFEQEGPLEELESWALETLLISEKAP